MPTLPGSDGSLQASHPAANDQHISAFCGIWVPVLIPAEPGIGVNGTAPHGCGAVNAVNILLGKPFFPERHIGPVLAETGITGKASHTFAYGIFPAGKCLVGKFRIRKSLASQFNKIRLPIRDHLIRKGRVVDSADYRYF